MTAHTRLSLSGLEWFLPFTLANSPYKQNLHLKSTDAKKSQISSTCLIQLRAGYKTMHILPLYSYTLVIAPSPSFSPFRAVIMTCKDTSSFWLSCTPSLPHPLLVVLLTCKDTSSFWLSWSREQWDWSSCFNSWIWDSRFFSLSYNRRPSVHNYYPDINAEIKQ